MGGAHKHKTDLQTRAGDALPTAALINHVKDAAWTITFRAIRESSWPPTTVSTAMLERVHWVALAILAGVCPALPCERLARCVGISEPQAPTLLAEMKASAWLWPGEDIAAVVARFGAAP